MTSFGFGTPATSAPAFGTGSFGFGTTPSTGTGFSFGATTSAPSTGFAFGAPATTTTSAFSFGTGLTPATTTFSFGGFGTTTTAPTFSFGGIGRPTTTTASSSIFSFGQGSAFGSTLGFGGFPSTTSTASTAFAAGTQALVNNNNMTNMTAALCCPIIYGDERDSILAKWNQLQAFWGIGKGYYAPNAPPVDFTPDNPFCCFKAIGYSVIPSTKTEDGLMSLIFNKKEQDICNHRQQAIDSLSSKLFGGKANFLLCIDTIKGVSDDKTEVVIFIIEKNATGSTRRVTTSEIMSHLEQVTVKPNITAMGIINAYPKMSYSKEQLQLYLDNPPAGLDPVMWQQAKADNPNPEKLIPVPFIGFTDLHKRMKNQEYETKQHQERLDMISDDIAELNRRHGTTTAKIVENKRKLIDLQHRVLKVLVQQEVMRKMGFSIQADEEQLRIKLEAIQAELSAPTQFKGHLKELISQIRMQNYQSSGGGEGERYTMDEVSKQKIKEHLKLQQEGIMHLMNIIKEDMANLRSIEEASKENADKKR